MSMHGWFPLQAERTFLQRVSRLSWPETVGSLHQPVQVIVSSFHTVARIFLLRHISAAGACTCALRKYHQRLSRTAYSEGRVYPSGCVKIWVIMFMRCMGERCTGGGVDAKCTWQLIYSDGQRP